MSEKLEQTAETTDDEVNNVVTETEEVVGDADNDASNDADFSDSDGESSDGEGNENSDPSKPKQSFKTEKNAESARIRREAEQQAAIEKAREEARKEARNAAIIETLNGMNPYTNEPIEDDADVEEYLTMKEIEKAGKDPVADYSRHLKARTKEQQKAAQSQSDKEDWVQKDREEFSTKHPDVVLDALLDNEMFRTFAKGKIGQIAMTQIYADYQAFEKKSEERAKSKAAQILANKAASPGKMSSANQNSPSYFTREQVQSMSMAEVKANYEKITESMKKWK